MKALILMFTAALAVSSATFAQDGFVSLMDGNDLDQWENPYKHGEAKVVDGEIHLTANKKFFLCTKEKFSDFIFEVELHLPEGKANSGVMFRCHKKPNRVWGYQAEADGSDRKWSGGLYDEGRRKWLHPKKPNNSESGLAFKKGPGQAFKRNDWNLYRIECRGDKIKIFVNGTLCTEYTDDMDSEGYIGLQHHGEKGQTYRFRNPRIKELD
ncbi:MAG: DUF1080 domain-containing protein [Akkermansiaceae bacterium]|nr:DUF1080 domain-containing protein [Akkermansiaceae bacterium]